MNRRAVRALKRSLADARARARDFDPDFDPDPAFVLALNLVRIQAYPSFRARARDPDLALAFDRACILADVLDSAGTHDPALDLALRLFLALDQPPAVAGARRTPGRLPWGLVTLAVQLLPAAQRPRYGVEFRGELVELQRWERWGYALRVLASAWELRRALVAAVKTSNGDVARRAER